jgi:foldase protein PrsA
MPDFHRNLIKKEFKMKRFFPVLLIPVLFLAGCGKSPKLEKNTPVYAFAKEMSAKIPYLDPDKNGVLVSTKRFKITSGEVLEEIFSTYGKEARQLSQLAPEQIKMNVEQMAMDLAGRRMLLEKAGKMKITASQAQVDSVLNAMMSQRGGKEKFDEELKKIGISAEMIKRDIRTQLVIDRYFSKHFAKDLEITEQDIQKAYSDGKTATVRHILMITRGKTDAEKSQIRQKMESILAQIKKGADFGGLAGLYSEDPGSSRRGGLVENFGRGDMVPAFDETAFSIPVGGISDVFETEYGYHILKVVDRKKDPRPLAVIRPELQKQVEQVKRRDLFPKIQSYMDELKQEYVLTVVKL